MFSDFGTPLFFPILGRLEVFRFWDASIFFRFWDALSLSQFDRFYPKFTELLGVLMQTLPPCVIEESKFFDKLINGLVTLLKFVQTMSDIY